MLFNSIKRYVYKISISLGLFVCFMSDHNSLTPWPICLIFWQGNSVEHENVLSLNLKSQKHVYSDVLTVLNWKSKDDNNSVVYGLSLHFEL